MAIPNNVSAAMTAADAALGDVETKNTALTSAGQALASAQKAADDAHTDAANAATALTAAKQQLGEAIDAWLTPPPATAGAPTNPAPQPVAGTTTVTASAGAPTDALANSSK